VSWHQLNSKNNSVASLLNEAKLSSVATDGKDGNGLKLEKIGALFQKITKTFLWLAFPDKLHLISSSQFYRSIFTYE